MKRDTLFILNPRAGTLRGRDSFFDVISIMSGGGFDVTVKITERAGHAAEIAASEGARYERLVCCGGDGTLHEVVCGLMTLAENERPAVGYIPAGTTNDFASNFEIPADPPAAARRLLEAKPVDIDVGRFGLASEKYFVYTASLGAFADSSFRTDQRAKNTLGYLAYIFDGIAHLGNIKPFHIRVTAGGDVFEDEFIFVSIANTMVMGGMLRLSNVPVELNDGLFELILIKHPRTKADVDDVWRSLVAHTADGRGLVRAQAPEVKIELDGQAVWTLDGEAVRSGESLTVRNMHRAIRLLV